MTAGGDRRAVPGEVVGEQEMEAAHSPLQQREAGILLHPTSLPGPREYGELGAEAFRFVDFLVAAGQRVWQILPLGPTHADNSPYQCFSGHAGNPELISLEQLVEAGWLSAKEAGGSRAKALRRAREGFEAKAGDEARAAYNRFLEEAGAWLDDFALYRVLKDLNGGAAWADWPAPARDRGPDHLERVAAEHAAAVEQVRFEQFLFYRQWHEVKAYANERGIRIFGDLPIFVAHDSADVWSRRENFLLDETGHPTVVAGVPPDYFSETGQRWGNPHYDWARMEADGFAWWEERLRGQLELYDLVRIDHFRGFEAYWEVPAEEETAINGRWVKAPGDALFERLHRQFDPLPIVAEDLGTIDEAVSALRRRFALPGMRILQFAFDGGADNPYLPHNHEPNAVVYTGTHDNDTTLGWLYGLDDVVAERLHAYLGLPDEAMPWPLVRAAYRSVARLAVIPMQDLLELGGEARMNQPGTIEGNWQWRFEWSQVPDDLAERVRSLAELYGRLAEG